MTIHQCPTAGSDQPSIAKLIPFQHLILLQTSGSSHSLLHSPPQETENAGPSSRRDALISTSKSRMSLLRNKGTKKSATILHAVPEATARATDLPDLQKTTAQADQHVSNKQQLISGHHASSSRSYYQNPSPRTLNSELSTVTSSKSDQAKEARPASNNTSTEGAIGIYKHGKIQWRQKDYILSANKTKNVCGADKGSRPKIHVVIPNGMGERPLPAIPFFSNPSRRHIVTASIQNEAVHDVSPPSACTKVITRNSVVSPLNQMQPISFGQFQRSMSRVVRKTSVGVPRHKRHVSKHSSSSIDSRDSDSTSTYSNRSSETSVEAESPPLGAKHMRNYSVQNPVAAGVFDSSPDSYVKPCTPPSASPPRRYAHQSPTEDDTTFQPTCPLQRTRNATGTLSRKPTVNRKSSKRNTHRQSLAFNNGFIDQAISRSTSRQLSDSRRRPSPTLSQAENELEEQLTSFAEDTKPSTLLEEEEEEEEEEDEDHGLTALTDDSPFIWDEVMARRPSHESVGQLRKDSATVDMIITLPPALPRKSSKRHLSANTETFRLSHKSRDLVASQMERHRSRGPSQRLTLTIPEYKRSPKDFEFSPISSPPKQAKRTITPTCAEGVILNIFRSLEHLDDLLATAVVNQGFRRVFKRHELDLIKSTLRKMSPPAWEFREIAFPGHDMLHDEDLEMTRPQEEYMPSTYLQLHKRDTNIIMSLKAIIKQKCQSFVRPEISAALISDNPAETSRIDDALWRIWIFCKTFGSGKGREDDIVAQQDWLRGGLLVHQQACTFSIMSTDYMNDTLVGAPESFAKGNTGGLTAEQLFDMMELWNCLGVLLQGFEGRTAQAREYGIYDETDIRGGDIDGEEMMLGMFLAALAQVIVLIRTDEWCYYLLTFGLSTVLELAGPCRQMNATPFKVAAQHGWNKWSPPVFGGSRRNFLKEAASRVYEDKIARTYATTSTREIQRQISKQRQQKHITELRNRKTNGPRMPMIHMSEERPMSEWSTVMGNLTRASPSSENDIVSHIPTFRSALAQELTASMAELPVAKTPPPPPSTRSSSPRRTIAQPLLPTPPPSTVPSVRDRNSIATNMPSIEEHPAYRKQDDSVPEVPSLLNHPAFRHQNPDTAVPSTHPYFQQPTYGHSRQSSDHSQQSNEHPAFQQHPTQHGIYASAAHENTAEKAIYRIVEMGFTAEQAREALKMTDLGSGLRVDSAVEFLLSRGY
jgi:hypothetical protein